MQLRARAEYYAYRAGSRVAQLLPGGVVHALADNVARAVVRRSTPRRAQVERNLERICGPLTPDEMRALVASTYRNYARYWAEFFRLPVMPRPLDDDMDVRGYEIVERSIAAGKGTIAAVPHVGCWDYAGAWFAEVSRAPVVVVEPLEPRELFEWFRATRESLGMEVVELGPGAGTALSAALAENRIVCLLADRDLTDDGVEVTFFGERTTMPAGPALLALRTGATLVPVSAYFRDGGGHVAVVSDPVPVARGTGRLRDDVAAITQVLASRFEELIRAAPDQWFVLQPRWPSDHDPDRASMP